MKEKLLETVKELKGKGIDLKQTPALFNWRYEEEPDILFQLLIKKDIEEVPEGETLQ